MPGHLLGQAPIGRTLRQSGGISMPSLTYATRLLFCVAVLGGQMAGLSGQTGIREPAPGFSTWPSAATAWSAAEEPDGEDSAVGAG